MDVSKKTDIIDSRAVYTPPCVVRINDLKQGAGACQQTGSGDAYGCVGTGNSAAGAGCSTGNSARVGGCKPGNIGDHCKGY